MNRVPILEAPCGRPSQVGIVVPDLDRALATHCEEWRVWTYGPDVLRESRYRGRSGSFSMRLALGGSEPQLEYIEPVGGPSLYHEWLDEHGPGLHHLGFFVDDAQVTIEAMEGAGFAVVQAGFGFGADGSGAFVYFDTVDALGYVTEAIEPPRVRRPPDRLWPGP